jgi:hypothetical protein
MATAAVEAMAEGVSAKWRADGGTEAALAVMALAAEAVSDGTGWKAEVMG